MSVAVRPAARDHDMRVRVVGPDADRLTEVDLRRLFPGSALTERRHDRLMQWSRCVAACGSRMVGVATYQCSGGDLRVPDIGIDASCGCRTSEIVRALLDAIELASLAADCQRILVTPPSLGMAQLARQGYVVMNEGCGGLWLEKKL